MLEGLDTIEKIFIICLPITFSIIFVIMEFNLLSKKRIFLDINKENINTFADFLVINILIIGWALLLSSFVSFAIVLLYSLLNNYFAETIIGLIVMLVFVIVKILLYNVFKKNYKNGK